MKQQNSSLSDLSNQGLSKSALNESDSRKVLSQNKQLSGIASQLLISPSNEMIHELDKLQSRLDSIDAKKKEEEDEML